MPECSACGCGGCAGCSSSSKVCSCDAVAAFTTSGYNGYAVQGGVFGQITPKAQARLKKMEDAFNKRHKGHKGWAIAMRSDHLNGWYGYVATKKGEPKKIEKNTLRHTEKAIDAFESEGELRKKIDRVL